MYLYIGLVHYPVYNKNSKIIASAITTVDLHDLSRLARTYNARKFFVITPLEDQQLLVEKVIRHWTKGYGARYNPNRKEAIELVAVSPSLEQTIEKIIEFEGKTPLIIATDASKENGRYISYEKARSIVFNDDVVILIFGTAWGLDKTVLNQADYVLDPVSGRMGYNHLSVRAAAAIILDRLAGARL
ncbi:MAG: RNA methyltransferase [Deltaproteobacteria bacterium]|nr:RNA methyltransferase [Deltaproteobacteria bacterium]